MRRLSTLVPLLVLLGAAPALLLATVMITIMAVLSTLLLDLPLPQNPLALVLGLAGRATAPLPSCATASG